VLYDRIYRTRVMLRNRSAVSRKVSLKVSGPFQKYIEMYPSLMFLQAGESQALNLKFQPETDIRTSLAHYSVAHEEFLGAVMLALPIQIKVRS